MTPTPLCSHRPEERTRSRATSLAPVPGSKQSPDPLSAPSPQAAAEQSFRGFFSTVSPTDNRYTPLLSASQLVRDANGRRDRVEAYSRQFFPKPLCCGGRGTCMGGLQEKHNPSPLGHRAPEEPAPRCGGTSVVCAQVAHTEQCARDQSSAVLATGPAQLGDGGPHSQPCSPLQTDVSHLLNDIPSLPERGGRDPVSGCSHFPIASAPSWAVTQPSVSPQERDRGDRT